MRITIGGPPGSGTTTIAKLLEQEFNYKRFNGGDIWDQMAEERNTDVMGLNIIAENDPSIDIELDERLVEVAKENENAIIESRLIGYFCHQKEIPAFKIWLTGELETRIKRLQKDARESEKVKEREESEKQRYKELYNIDIDDLSVYDLVVKTDDKLPDAILVIIKNAISTASQS